MDCRKDLTAGGGLGLCCSSAGRSDDMIKHGDLRRDDNADLRCVRREDGPDRTVRAAILLGVLVDRWKGDCRISKASKSKARCGAARAPDRR